MDNTMSINEMRGQTLTPHIHWNTKNYSALKVHSVLKSLGVKNNTFMLTIYDTDLMYIDPFDPNLSQEMKNRVHAEVVRNYWYFLREIVRINTPGGTTMFTFHRGNTAIAWLAINNINYYVELPRQMTKTGTHAAFFAYVWSFGSINSKAAFMSKDPESAKSNLESVKNIIENLPPYLNMLDEKLDTSNIEKLQSATSGNIIQVRTPPGVVSKAINKGRGSSEPHQWYDETPHTAFIREIILNSASAWATAANFAKNNGVPYGRFYSSTPGILGTPSGDFIFYELLPQCVKFDEELFYDQPSIGDLKQMIYEQSKNDFVYIRFTYKQLGKGEDYYKDQCRYLNNDLESISREVLLLWTRRQQDSPFTKEQLEKVYSHLRTPVKSIVIRNTYVLNFFKKVDLTKKYVIAVDCSGMLGRDYSSIVVTDPQTFEAVATLRSNARTNYSNTRSMSLAIEDIALKIFKNALIAIEKNNMGIAVIDNIITDAPELVPRMYATALEPTDYTENSESIFATDMKNYKFERKVIAYGFDTTKARRAQMYEEIAGIIVNELFDGVNDEDIYNELCNIIRTPKGRLDHRDGQHDDMLMSWMIGIWILVHSKILTTRYDYPIGYIRPLSVTDDNTPNEAQIHAQTDFEKMGNLIIQTYKGNPYTPINQIAEKNINPNFRDDVTSDVRTRTVRDENEFESGFDIRNMDGDQMADIIFGDSKSVNTIIRDSEADISDAEFEMLEDSKNIPRELSKMSKTEQNAFLKTMQEQLDYDIDIKKKKYTENLNRSNKRAHLKDAIKDKIKDTAPEGASDEFINTMVQKFLE